MSRIIWIIYLDYYLDRDTVKALRLESIELKLERDTLKATAYY